MKHMDSTAEAMKLGPRIMPYLAILQHDLMTLRASRLVRLWFGATVVLTLLLMAANWTRFQSAPLIASLLFPYLVFPWFFVVVALGVSPVSGSRTDVVADGILSRPVSRSAYLLATWSARVVLIWGVYLVVMVPAVIVVTLAKRPVPDDTVTIYGIVTAVGVVGLVLTFLTSLAFLAGTLLRGPLLALVVLVFLWYPVGLILSVFSLEEFSPISLSRAISTQLRQTLRTPQTHTDGNARAEETSVFPKGVEHFLEVFSEAPSAPKATKPDFFESEAFRDFSLLRVVLGYGAPTVMAVILAMLSFCWRDL
jgi:ABC-type transport system involved in multi-copper enzyme maturation permease subunit